MDTSFFLRAHNFLFHKFAHPDSSPVFLEFPDVVRPFQKSQSHIQLFSFVDEVQYNLVLLLRMGFPFLSFSDLETGSLDFIIQSGPSSRWISTLSETPPSTWSLVVDEGTVEQRKAFVLRKMAEVVSAFDRLALSIITVEEFAHAHTLATAENVLCMKQASQELSATQS